MVQRKNHSVCENLLSGEGDNASVNEVDHSKKKSSKGSTAVLGEKSPSKEKNTVVKQRRSRVPDKPNISFSLWSIMKNCIGRDLSRIPVPVNFSEPLSMLQRLVEDFEYSEVLDKGNVDLK